MELILNLEYTQILNLIRQLSPQEIDNLMLEVQKEKKHRPNKENTSLQKLLLKGPTWSEEEYSNYLEARNHFNQLTSI
jgi:hypothetical protein